MKIYTPSVSNEHLSVLPCNADEWMVKSFHLNTNRMLENWKQVDFELKGFNKNGKKNPIITLIRGSLAFRKGLEDIIIQEKCKQIELLPIMVSGEDWFVVNCLFSTDRYDVSRSTLFRRGNGEVYMINDVYLLGGGVAPNEFFYLSNSNKSTLLALPHFVNRITALGSSGIEFKKIGEIMSV